MLFFLILHNNRFIHHNIQLLLIPKLLNFFISTNYFPPLPPPPLHIHIPHPLHKILIVPPDYFSDPIQININFYHFHLSLLHIPLNIRKIVLTMILIP